MDIPANEAERLVTVHALDPMRGVHHPPLDRLAQLAADVCKAPIAIISLIDEDRQEYVSSIGTNVDGVDRSDSFCTLAILDDGVITTNDASVDPRFRDNVNVTADNGIRSYVGVPVRGMNGLAVGTLCIASPEVNAFNLEHRRRLELVAELVTEHFTRLQSEYEAREAKKRIKAVERRAISYEHAVEAIRDGVIIIDRNGEVVAANTSARQMFDDLIGDLIGRSYRRDTPNNIIRPDGSLIRPAEFAVAQTFSTHRGVTNMMYGLPMPGGARRWVSTSTTPVYDGDGEIDYVVQTTRDVTESHLHTRALEAALREAEKAKDYARALNTIAEAVAITDAKGICIDCNDGFLKLTGRTREEQIGHDKLNRPLARYAEDGSRLPDENSAIRHALETRRPVRDSSAAIEVAGERRWHAISATPILDENGDVMRVVLIFRDIHEERMASSMLSATVQQAKRAQLALNTIAEGVHLYDAAGVIIDTNQSAARILGLTRDQMMGRAFVDPRWRVIGPDGLPLASEELPIARCLATGKAIENGVMGVERPDGTRAWISVNAVPMRGLDRSIVNVAITFRDITEQKRADEQLKVALEEARRSSQAKSDFLAVVSHELRTPMNAVLGAAQMLSMKRLDPEERRTLAMLEDSGRQMMTLLNDLFDVAALEGDRVRIEPEPVSIGALVEEAAMICRRDAEDKGLAVEIQADPRLAAPRLIDPSRLRQIMGNLLVNAVKFTERGGVRICTSLVERPEAADQVMIEVTDTGVGIASEDLERIFSPFEQADASTRRRHGGMGIGLNIVRRLSRQMGGDIVAESEPGRGSTFTVTLDAPIANVGKASEAPPEQFSAESCFNLLCVDDNPRNLIVIAALLRAAGHAVRECGSGECAVRAASEEVFDIILLDMVMPDMDGLDVLAAIHGNPGPNQMTPIIACTANVMPEQLKSYLAAGVADVVEKPIQAAVLLEAVNAVARAGQHGARAGS